MEHKSLEVIEAQFAANGWNSWKPGEYAVFAKAPRARNVMTASPSGFTGNWVEKVARVDYFGDLSKLKLFVGYINEDKSILLGPELKGWDITYS